MTNEHGPTVVTEHRRPDIQGLRAVAVGLVMVYHAGIPLPGGFIGVDVFFVVSGFVITGLLMREYARTGRIRFSEFYGRRIRRLLPALAVMTSVTVVVAFTALPLRSQQVTARTGVAASIFLANVEIMRSTGGYFDATAEENALLHTWSLAVEEQFYLAFPALLLIGWTIAARRKRAATPISLVAAVLGLSFAASWAFSKGIGLPGLAAPEEVAFYGAPTRAWQFAAGAMLALGWAGVVGLRARLPPAFSCLVAWSGAALVAVGALRIEGTHYPGLAALVPTVGTALLLATGDADPSPLGRLLRSRPAVFVGNLSYSLYLWHWPVLLLGNALLPAPRVLTSTLLVLGAAIPAYASFRWVEEPFRRARGLSGRRLVPLVLTCVLVPGILSAVLWWGSGNAWWNPETTAWETARTQRPVSRTAGCHTTSDANADPPQGECVFGSGDRGTILVLGDSHAAALGDSVIAAATSTGYRVAIHTTNGCPFLADVSDWDIWGGTAATRACLDGLQNEWALVEATNPELVVIANSSSMYVRESTVYRDDDIAAARWREAVGETLSALKERGIPALLVHEVPEHPKSLAACTRSWGIDRSCVNSPHEYSTARRALSHKAELDAVANVVGASGWDPVEVLCDGLTCFREHDATPIYLDRSHLNPSAASLLGQPLRGVLLGNLGTGRP